MPVVIAGAPVTDHVTVVVVRPGVATGVPRLVGEVSVPMSVPSESASEG